jgi:hypothetical protein
MDIQELEGKWAEMVKATFDTFIDENIGRDDGNGGGTPPKCFGSGDDHTYCVFCEWQKDCDQT